MSRMNGSQAIQAALDAAMSKRGDIAVIRVSGDEGAMPQVTPRRLTLPLREDAQLSFAIGCAAAGLTPVLDLTGVRDGARRLESAIHAAANEVKRRRLIFRLSDRYCPRLDGVRVVRPANSRESAMAMRDALTGRESVLILEDPLRAFEVCDVTDDVFDFDPAPPPAEISEEGAEEAVEDAAQEAPEAVAEEAADEAHGDVPAEVSADEDAAPDENDSGDAIEIPAPAAAMGMRWRKYDGAELRRTAALLNVGADDVAKKCVVDIGEGIDVVLETGAQPGETAILPPDHFAARLWVGYDAVSLCWQGGRMTNAEAKRALDRAVSALELPARLIMK